MIRRAPRTLRERRRRRRAIPLIRPATDLILRLHDGRRLGVAEFGSRSALPVIYLHGFIGSRLEPAAVEIEDTNIISFDRPGYGRTDLQRLPSLRAWGADVAEALVQLGVADCILVGVSTGAPYALAVAAALGSRAKRVILAGGIAGPEVLETAGGTALVLSMIGRRGSRTGPARPPAPEPRAGDASRPPAHGHGRRRASGRRWSARGSLTDVLHARLLQSFRSRQPARHCAVPWPTRGWWPSLGTSRSPTCKTRGRAAARHRRSGGAAGARPLVCGASALCAARHDPGRAAPLHVLSQCRPHPGELPRARRTAGAGQQTVALLAGPRPIETWPAQSARKYSTVETTRRRLAIW